MRPDRPLLRSACPLPHAPVAATDGSGTHAHSNERPPHAWRKGAFRRRDGASIARWQCRRCGKHFSDQTRTATWRLRRTDIDGALLSLLAQGVSQRAASRLLGVNRKTVCRRVRAMRRAMAARDARPPSGPAASAAQAPDALVPP